VLYAYPGVQEATVVGIPDPSLGEEVVALVVAKAGAELNPEAIKAHTREQVAAYKYPRHVLIVDELPKGPTGKIFKRAIDRGELMRSLGLPKSS
jgi:long-chain acyl-CoA synthetase